MSKTPRVAATVNGDPIYEGDVTEFIEGFRMKNTQYETDMGWAEFLRSNGYTSESMRSYVIDTVFIPKELIRQECKARGIQITDAELDKIIAREKEYYERRYGDNSWSSVLASFGYDEQSWRQNELDRLLEEQLRTAVIGKVTPSEAEVQAKANDVAASYSGKSSHYIEFDTQEQAQAARERIQTPANLAGFSVLGPVTYAGWNSLPSYRDSMSKEYIQASNALNVGDVSAPVNTYGKWLLIFCDAAFSEGTGGESVVLKKLPDEIYDQIYLDASETKVDQIFNEWLENQARVSQIDIEPMPDGLPYSVNVTIAG